MSLKRTNDYDKMVFTLSLIELIEFFKENFKFLTKMVISSCFVTTIYLLFLAQNFYTSGAIIIPANSSNSNLGKFAGMAAQLGLSMPSINDSEGQVMVYPELIKSRTIARKLTYRKFDTNKYGSQKSLLQILMIGDDEPEFGIDTLEEMSIEYIIENMIRVQVSDESPIVKIFVDAIEPNLAAEVNNALIEELDNHQKMFNTRQAVKKRKFIEERIININKDLVYGEEQLKIFRQQNRSIQSSPALLLEQERLIREIEVQKSLYITLKQELEMAKIEEVEDSDILFIIDQPNVPLQKSKPKRKLIVVLAALFSFLVAIIFIYCQKYLVPLLYQKK
tara:strand:+ start:2928 stop:3932 length:1005 start_codon:yes stop_codon:yes gene_type:complete